MSEFEVTPEQLSELRDVFDVLNERGKLTCNQLGVAMRAIGENPTEAELYEMMNEVDHNNDGEIDFKQFCTLMVKHLEELSSEEYLRQAFNIFDRDSDGFITTAEMKAVIYNLGERIPEDEFDLMMQEIDFDNDGVITYAEFVRAMRE